MSPKKTPRNQAAPAVTPDYNAAEDQARNVIGTRLREERTRRGYSLSGFSALLARYGVDISRTGIHKWEMGAAVPNGYQLLAAARALQLPEGLSLFYVGPSPRLNAEGQRKLRDYEEDLIASGRYSSVPAEEPVTVLLPHSNLLAAAGTGSFLDEGNFETREYPARLVPEGADFSLNIAGDSMEPRYHDGDLVFVRLSERLRPGEVGLFTYDGLGFIKVYGEQEPPEEARDAFTDSYGVLRPQPVLLSLNPAYPPRPVSPEKPFRVIGRIL